MVCNRKLNTGGAATRQYKKNATRRPAFACDSKEIFNLMSAMYPRKNIPRYFIPYKRSLRKALKLFRKGLLADLGVGYAPTFFPNPVILHR